jgi:hypothetical protein
MYAELPGYLTLGAGLDSTEGGYSYVNVDLGGEVGVGRAGSFSLSGIGTGSNSLSSGTTSALTYDDEAHWGVSLGDVSTTLDAPLLSSVSGFGVAARARMRNTEVVPFYFKGAGFTGGQTWGVQARHYLTPSFDFHLTGLAQSGQLFRAGEERLPQTTRLWGGSARWHRGSGSYIELDTALSHGEVTRTDHAQRLSGRYSADGFSLGAEWIHAGPDFTGAWQDTEFLRADFAVAPIEPLRIYGDYTRRRDNLENDPADDVELQERRRIGADVQLERDTRARAYIELDDRSDPINGTEDSDERRFVYEIARDWSHFELTGVIERGVEYDYLAGVKQVRSEQRLHGSVELTKDDTLGFDLVRSETDSPGFEDQVSYDVGLNGDFITGKNTRMSFSGHRVWGGGFGATMFLDGQYERAFKSGHKFLLRGRHSTGSFASESAFATEWVIPLSPSLRMFPLYGAVSGRIYLEGTDTPVGGIRVALDNQEVLVGEDGLFSIGPVPPGPHEFTVVTESLGAGYTLATESPQQVEISAGEIAQLDVALRRLAQISGVVRLKSDAQSDATSPAAGIVLELLKADGTVSRRVTDGLGRYSFGDVTKGSYTLRIWEGSIPQYHLAEPTEHSVTVTPGEQKPGLDFTVAAIERKIEITTEIGAEE